jgi:hypothetical protein
MLWDKVWAAAGLDHDDGWFCIGCIEKRLGRKLVLADFNNAPCNFMFTTVMEYLGFTEDELLTEWAHRQTQPEHIADFL